MVLILLFIISCAQIDTPKGELLMKYDKEVRKGISKNLKIKDFDLLRREFKQGEAYSITKNEVAQGLIFVSEVAACNLGGCPSYKKVESDVSSEYFDMMVILDKRHNIRYIKILDYFSDYGYEITSKKYLKRFIGKNISSFQDESDDIDAISGATISSYALEGMLSQISTTL